jgi:hypothetical protein
MKPVVRAAATVLLYTMPLSACYSYQPVPSATPLKAGSEVRTYLAAPRSFALGSASVNDVNRLEGTVYAGDGDPLSLWTTWLYTQYGGRQATNGSVFSVNRGEIAQLQERTFQAVPSVLLVGGIIGAVVGLLAIAATGGLGGSGGGGDGGTTLPRVVAPVTW